MMNTDHHEFWQRVRFKTNKVWLAVAPDGQAIVQNGKVRIKYQLDQEYEYWVHARNIQALPSDGPTDLESAHAPRESNLRPVAENPGDDTTHEDSHAVHIYTDGASAGNPGPAGIGVLLRYGTHEKEISEFIGVATNNVAELQAIQAGLSQLKDTRRPVRLYTDSAYARGVLTLGWKAKKNQDLIRAIKAQMARIKDLQLIKIKGHAGEEGNERADRLATDAIKKSGLPGIS
jgi:ribonuclease HI